MKKREFEDGLKTIDVIYQRAMDIAIIIGKIYPHKYSSWDKNNEVREFSVHDGKVYVTSEDWYVGGEWNQHETEFPIEWMYSRNSLFIDIVTTEKQIWKTKIQKRIATEENERLIHQDLYERKEFQRLKLKYENDEKVVD